MGLATRENAIDDSSDNSTPISQEQISIASEDTFINRTSLNPEQYPEVFSAITSYVEGSPVVVEYFRLRGNYINQQTLTASFSLERAATRFSYDLIHDLEFKLQDQLEIEIDSETNETSIKGVGIMYAGMKPKTGDVFYFKLPDDQIGVMLVNKATPLSIHRGTNYRIEFHLYAFITEDIDDKIRSSVSEHLYFDKQKYFSDDAALLSSTSFNQYKALIEFRKDIVQRQFSQFYKSGEKTFVRKDRIYDPFAVRFWLAKLSINDYPRTTPLCEMNTRYNWAFKDSIWQAVLDKDCNQLTKMISSICSYDVNLWDSDLSSFGRFDINILQETTDSTIDDRLNPLSRDGIVLSSYIFSRRLYSALIKYYETGTTITDVDPILTEYQDDVRFSDKRDPSMFAFNKNSYLPFNDFTNEDIENTHSNNNLHLPDGEFLIYEWLVYQRIDIEYLVDTVIPLFPFTNMTDNDKFYYYPIILHLVDAAISKLR